MTARLTHRGPDEQGIWADDEHGVGLGHTRLSILDLSEAGASQCHRPVGDGHDSMVKSITQIKFVRSCDKLAAGSGEALTLRFWLKHVQNSDLPRPFKNVTECLLLSCGINTKKKASCSRSPWQEATLFHAFRKRACVCI